MSDLRAGVDIVLHATRTGSGDLVSGRWNIPSERENPTGFNREAESLGAALAYVIHHGASSVCIDLAHNGRLGDTISPGEAAFECWAQEQIGDSGFRDDEWYWDALSKEERAMWHRIALAARRPLDPLNAPKKRKRGVKT